MARGLEECPQCGAKVAKDPLDSDLYVCSGCQRPFTLARDERNEPVGLAERTVEPLRLPRGSLRAFSTVAISLSFLAIVAAGREVPALLLELDLAVLGYYFGFRRSQREVVLGGRRALVDQPEPLWLPHGAIRLLLIGVLASSAAILHQRGELAGARIGEFFAIVAALVLGHLYAKHVDALLEGPAGEAMDHLKGLGVLAATLYLCASFFDARLVVHERLPTLAAALVSFYFGSRT